MKFKCLSISCGSPEFFSVSCLDLSSLGESSSYYYTIHGRSLFVECALFLIFDVTFESLIQSAWQFLLASFLFLFLLVANFISLPYCCRVHAHQWDEAIISPMTENILKIVPRWIQLSYTFQLPTGCSSTPLATDGGSFAVCYPLIRSSAVGPFPKQRVIHSSEEAFFLLPFGSNEKVGFTGVRVSSWHLDKSLKLILSSKSSLTPPGRANRLTYGVLSSSSGDESEDRACTRNVGSIQISSTGVS